MSPDVKREINIAKSLKKPRVEYNIDGEAARTTFFKDFFDGCPWVEGFGADERSLINLCRRVHDELEKLKDMGKKPSEIDEIKELIKRQQAVSVAAAGAAAGGAGVSALLKKAKLQIEDGDFEAASATCDKASDIDVESAELWICRLLIEARVMDLEGLSGQFEDYTYSGNYIKAARFAFGEVKENVINAVESAKARLLQKQSEERVEAERKRKAAEEEAERQRAETERRAAEQAIRRRIEAEQRAERERIEIAQTEERKKREAEEKAELERIEAEKKAKIYEEIRRSDRRKGIAAVILIVMVVVSSGYGMYAWLHGRFAFTLIKDESLNGYEVEWKGFQAKGNIVIPSEYKEQPVVAIKEYGFASAQSIGFERKKLTSVVIPDSVVSIGDGAFNLCTGLTNVSMGKGVTNIGRNAFGRCENLTKMAIPDSVTSIGSGAFSGTGLTYITIPSGMTVIGEGAFSGCTGLTDITIPDNVTSIGDRAFLGCTSLTDITVPEGVTSIGGYAFYECNLNSITLPGSLTFIGDYAFNSSRQSEVYYVGSIIWNYNPELNLSNRGFTPVITTIIIPAGITSVKNEAFLGFTGLTSIMIPDSVASIGSYAFANCTSLSGIVIPDSVTVMGERVFSSWTNSQTIYIQTYINRPAGWNSLWSNGSGANVVWNAEPKK